MNNKPVEQEEDTSNGDLKKSLINDDAKNGQANGGLGATNVDGKTGAPEHAKNHASGDDCC